MRGARGPRRHRAARVDARRAPSSGWPAISRPCACRKARNPATCQGRRKCCDCSQCCDRGDLLPMGGIPANGVGARRGTGSSGLGECGTRGDRSEWNTQGSPPGPRVGVAAGPPGMSFAVVDWEVNRFASTSRPDVLGALEWDVAFTQGLTAKSWKALQALGEAGEVAFGHLPPVAQARDPQHACAERRHVLWSCQAMRARVTAALRPGSPPAAGRALRSGRAGRTGQGHPSVRPGARPRHGPRRSR